jgi:hypothetical protein
MVEAQVLTLDQITKLISSIKAVIDWKDDAGNFVVTYADDKIPMETGAIPIRERDVAHLGDRAKVLILMFPITHNKFSHIGQLFKAIGTYKNLTKLVIMEWESLKVGEWIRTELPVLDSFELMGVHKVSGSAMLSKLSWKRRSL